MSSSSCVKFADLTVGEILTKDDKYNRFLSLVDVSICVTMHPRVCLLPLFDRMLKLFYYNKTNNTYNLNILNHLNVSYKLDLLGVYSQLCHI